MWKDLYELIRQVLMLARDTRSNREDIKKLRVDLDDLTRLVQHLVYDNQSIKDRLEHISERERHEREKMLLKLEIKRLKAERGLPPATDDDKE